MSSVRQFVSLRGVWALGLFLVAVLLLLPNLGKPGFWEPQEIGVADRAQRQLETHSLQTITKTVAAHYKLKPSRLKSSAKPRKDNVLEARNVAIFLAMRHTRETFSDLRREFGVEKHEVVESVIQGIIERLGDSSEVQLQASIEAIEKQLATPKRKSRQKKQTRPQLTESLVAQGLSKVSWDEWGARLPLALLGILAVMATFLLGLRLGSTRAGVISGLVLLTFPLFLLQSRQLTSDIGAVAGSTVLAAGLVGLAWPNGRPGSRWWLWLRYPADAAMVVVGAWLAYHGAGALLGLLAPIAAVGLASLLALISDRNAESFGPDEAPPDGPWHGERLWREVHLLMGGTFFVLVSLLILCWVFFAVFLTPDTAGEASLFGQRVDTSKHYVEALGGQWRVTGNLSHTFNSLFEQLAFGLFPWSALAPIAVAHAALGARRGRRRWGGYIVFSWTLFAWIVATVMTRKVGSVHYPALAAVALAVGLWLDDLLTARTWADERDPSEDNASVFQRARERFGLSLTLPVVAVFVAGAAIVLAKDMIAFPQKVTSLQTLDAIVAYPDGVNLANRFLIVGILFGISVGAGVLWYVRGKKLPADYRAVMWVGGRYGVYAGIAVTIGFGIFLAQVWTPTLSRKLSSKHLFSVYQSLKSDEDKLGVMGNHGSGPKYYAGDSFLKLNNRNDLIAFLTQTENRSFALVPASELCPVHRQAKDKFAYYVLDDSHAKFLLLSNRLKSNEHDVNPLARSILRTRPEHVGRPLDFTFDDKIQLIGVDMPKRVDRSSTFKVTLFFKVLKPVGGAWKIFAHFDGGGMRFQGDHTPINGRCSTSFWQKDDYIVDTFSVSAGDITYAKTGYTLNAGFFQGSSGNWRNMPVSKGARDNNNRVRVGTVHVK